LEPLRGRLDGVSARRLVGLTILVRRCRCDGRDALPGEPRQHVQHSHPVQRLWWYPRSGASGAARPQRRSGHATPDAPECIYHPRRHTGHDQRRAEADHAGARPYQYRCARTRSRHATHLESVQFHPRRALPPLADSRETDLGHPRKFLPTISPVTQQHGLRRGRAKCPMLRRVPLQHHWV
jgi:hypothetical protein